MGIDCVYATMPPRYSAAAHGVLLAATASDAAEFRFASTELLAGVVGIKRSRPSPFRSETGGDRAAPGITTQMLW